jgi:hypothetical protein
MNPYAKFVELLPKQSQWVGKIMSISDTGIVSVNIPGSNTNVNVRGDGSNTYAQYDYVYIVDGVIQGKTPNLQTLLQEEII